jgi:TonB family protein
LQQAGSTQEKCCTLAGKVTDPSGADVMGATITITNVATSGVITLKTDGNGQYAAKDLAAGKYNVRAESSGFQTTTVNGVEVKEGKAVQVNIKLEISWGGCCEYAAAPMIVPEVMDTKPFSAYSFKVKPFTYNVGEADDHGTLRGIAKLVYGDQKMWVQIFEANPDSVVDPNSLPPGTSFTIPPPFLPEPKPATRILPPYPSEALNQHVHGEVAMDVRLNDDGSVQTVKVIEGNPLFSSAAIDAVKQWKYRPLKGDGELVKRTVVVITFEKNGKVH